MILAPRSGLWTPRSRPPSLMLPFGVAGTEPIGYHSRVAGAPTITRAGVRYHRNGASYVSVAENKHACETDADGKRYVSVYGERTNQVLQSGGQSGWTTYDCTQSDSGVASPVPGVNWTRIVETTGAGKLPMLYRAAGPAPAQNQKFLVAALAKFGDRYCTLRVDDAAINVDLESGVIVDTGQTANHTLHAYGIVPIAATTWLLWMVASDATVTPVAPTIVVHCADSAELSNGTYDIYTGDAGAHPLGVLFADAAVIIGATGPGPIIPTTTAAVTKVAEVIAWPVADYGIPGSVELHVRTRDTVPTDKRIWSWYDADGDAAIELFPDSAGHVHLRVHNGTGEVADIEVATAVNTGAWFPVRAAWEHNYVRLRVGSTDAIDTSCTMPALAALDASRLGASKAGQQFDGDIAEFRAHTRRII